jgi:hypothetical protein
LAAIIREGGNHHKKRANEIALRHAETRLKYSTKYFKKKIAICNIKFLSKFAVQT